VHINHAYLRFGNVEIVEVDIAKGINRKAYPKDGIFPSLEKVTSKARPTFIYRENNLINKVDP
jgi:hypothetical protein